MARKVNLIQMYEVGGIQDRGVLNIQVYGHGVDNVFRMDKKGKSWPNIPLPDAMSASLFIKDVLSKVLSPSEERIFDLYYLDSKSGKFKELTNIALLPKTASNIYSLKLLNGPAEPSRLQTPTIPWKCQSDFEFRKRGYDMMDYIVDYIENIANRPSIHPNVEPGFMSKIFPKDPPFQPDSCKDIMEDVDAIVTNNVVHRRHPGYCGYFPTAISYPSLLADMLVNSLGAVGTSWAACPVLTEMESLMLDWLAKMIGLPESFLTFGPDECNGGGVMQVGPNETLLYCMLCARAQLLKGLGDETDTFPRLVAYGSTEARPALAKAAKLSMITLRTIEPDDQSSLRGDALRKMIEKDIGLGLIPVFVCATLGTFGTGGFDNLKEIGTLCNEYEIWLHVDAAYAGNAFICPEFRKPLEGVEYAMSFSFSPVKLMLIDLDGDCLWVQDRNMLIDSYNVNPVYLQHANDKVAVKAAVDFRHWGIPLSRTFRSMKLWFVIRRCGTTGLQEYVRQHWRFSEAMEKKILSDDRFQICGTPLLGMISFRLIADDDDDKNKLLLEEINNSGKLSMLGTQVNHGFILVMTICAGNTTEADLDNHWAIIRDCANKVMTH